jgi:hypothetical protein
MSDHAVQIKSEQSKDGSFTDPSGKPSVMNTAFVLSCLTQNEETKELKNIKSNAVRYLISQKNKAWKFSLNTAENYFILSVLAEFDKEMIDGEAIAKILTELVSLESKEGGPYYSDNKNKKIDRITNAAIARFLSALGVELPNLEPFQNLLNTTEKIKKAFRLKGIEIAKESPKTIGFRRRPTAGNPAPAADAAVDQTEQVMMSAIREAAKKRFAKLAPEFREYAQGGIEKTIRGNRDKQMSLMSYYMKQALGKKAKKIPDELVAEMGLANIFFWTAFIIYDDFWDEDEAADPHILPTANLYARNYVDLFSSILPEKTGFRAFYHTLMDDLDGANTWETIHCRTKVEGSVFTIPEVLPDYGKYENKYRPASGHILGPVAMLVRLGYGVDSPEVKNLISYFKNYLIAMQLNDDAHDWEEDMARGHLSTVVVLLLNGLKASGWRSPTIDLRADIETLRKVFWFNTIKKYAEIVKVHTKASRKALRALDILEDPKPLLRFITITEETALDAEREQEKSADFLKNYKA